MDDLNMNVVGDIYGDNGCALDDFHSRNNALQNFVVDMFMGMFMIAFIIAVAICYVLRIDGSKLIKLLSWNSKTESIGDGNGTGSSAGEVNKDA